METGRRRMKKGRRRDREENENIGIFFPLIKVLDQPLIFIKMK